MCWAPLKLDHDPFWPLVSGEWADGTWLDFGLKHFLEHSCLVRLHINKMQIWSRGWGGIVGMFRNIEEKISALRLHLVDLYRSLQHRWARTLVVLKGTVTKRGIWSGAATLILWYWHDSLEFGIILEPNILVAVWCTHYVIQSRCQTSLDHGAICYVMNVLGMKV